MHMYFELHLNVRVDFVTIMFFNLIGLNVMDANGSYSSLCECSIQDCQCKRFGAMLVDSSCPLGRGWLGGPWLVEAGDCGGNAVPNLGPLPVCLSAPRACLFALAVGA